jgi:methyltransferase (TIGR00027 family)
MARTDDDTWDLASSVGATATLVAAARALATRRHDPLVDDPFAEPLVRAVGIGAFTQALDGAGGAAGLADTPASRLLVDVVAVRTRFFDDFLMAAAAAGIRQAVILASGLDARAYRLPWPDGMRVFEIDRGEVVDFKAGVLARQGAASAAELHTVAVDLRDDWAAALRAAGFDDTEPTAWIAEGLLVYLPAHAQERLFETITALSAPGSRIATEYHPDGGSGIARRASAMSARLAAEGLDLNLGELFYADERRPVVDHLEDLGWDVSSRPRPEMFAAYGRLFPEDAEDRALRNSFSITAIRKAAP